MNLVEVWFGIVERQAIRRGVFKSVRDLNTKIRVFINGWNDRSHPFVWTKTAEEVLAKANPKKTSCGPLGTSDFSAVSALANEHRGRHGGCDRCRRRSDRDDAGGRAGVTWRSANDRERWCWPPSHTSRTCVVVLPKTTRHDPEKTVNAATDYPVIPGYRAGTWKVDPTQSTIRFSLRQLVGKARGRFTSYDVAIVTGDDLLESSVTATIDLASVDTANQKRDKHLRGPDYLKLEEHPTVTYYSDRLRRVVGGFVIEGFLTLHGTTQPVALNLEVKGFSTDTVGQERASFIATAQLSRREFGLTLPGGSVVASDRVTVTAEIKALLQS
jgi:polyisoprenoid-binding protein YceI